MEGLMESKPLGDLSPMLSAMEQDSQYIYRVSDLEDRKMVSHWLRVVPSLLRKIYSCLNESTPHADLSTKTEQ